MSFSWRLRFFLYIKSYYITFSAFYERYPSVLHLNDEMLIIVGNTIDVKDAATEIISISKLFLILECYALDLKLTFKQVVQKINQQVLAELLTEETLEAPVGKGVDVS